VDANVIGPASLAISQGITAFLAFTPRLSDVRKADAKTETTMVGDVRLGEVAATAITVGVGVIASSLTGSPVPAIVAALVALTLICVYESALNSDHAWEPKRMPERATNA
jgi:hypothetical protein